MDFNRCRKRSWWMFLLCWLLAAGIGWLVDVVGRPRPLWATEGNFPHITYPVAYLAPWLVTLSDENTKLNVVDLSSGKNQPVRSIPYISNQDLPRWYGEAAQGQEFCFIESEKRGAQICSRIKRWNLATGELKVVREWVSTTGKSYAIMSKDGSRVLRSEELSIEMLSLLAPPTTLGPALTAGVHGYCATVDKFSVPSPVLMEAIDTRDGRTISRFALPGMQHPIGKDELSSNGKWLVKFASSIPYSWSLAKGTITVAGKPFELHIYDTSTGVMTARIPTGKDFAYPVQWYGDMLSYQLSIANYHNSSMSRSMMYSESPGAVIDATSGKSLQAKGVSNHDGTYSIHDNKLVYLDGHSIVEIQLNPEQTLEQSFAKRKSYDISHLNSATYQMRFIPQTTKLALFRHADANSCWQRLSVFVSRFIAYDHWKHLIPHYHSVELYDYTTGNQQEVRVFNPPKQNMGTSNQLPNLLRADAFTEKGMITELWSSDVRQWSVVYSILAGFVALLVLLVLTRAQHLTLAIQARGGTAW